MALARKQQLCQHTRSLLHKQHFFCRREQIKQSQCRVTCADPVNQQGALPLHSGYKVEHAGLLHKVTVKWLREIVFHNTTITQHCGPVVRQYTSSTKGTRKQQQVAWQCLLLRHFPMFKIAGYYLTQNNIIYLWASDWSWQREWENS